MLTLLQRMVQRYRIRKIEKQLESLSYNMQFEDLDQKAIDWHNDRIEKLTALKHIEECVLEAM